MSDKKRRKNRKRDTIRHRSVERYFDRDGKAGKLISGAKQILIITAASNRLLINYLISEVNGETPVAETGASAVANPRRY